ncbi:hypothetical protein [Breznakia pachnodae]|uniref:Uncharacterized protein n=1 Tax=Breznakia pachnodae TaxID=265178 RepID=A0ABU0E6I5_9FIRM|nr:hypothetical protein [Breznakia pachnodae]MDQ0362522.1 hypothetical protein [Breznakia pachnodae]
MKKIKVDVVVLEQNNEREPLFIVYQDRKHKISHSTKLQVNYYSNNNKALAYKVKIASVEFKLYNDFIKGAPTTHWFVDGDACELFAFNNTFSF